MTRFFFSVSALTLLSRVLGLCRDVVIAAVFGAGAVTDAFFAAFRLPNMLRRFSAEGAMAQAFVPVYAEQRARSRAAARRLAGEMMATLAAALLAVSAAGAAAAPWVMAALAPGLDEAALAADLFRVVLPYIVLVSLVALAAGVLNVEGYFGAAAAAPILFNIALIAAAWWATDYFAAPIFALAWGVLAGGAAQLLWVLWHLRRVGAMPRWAWARRARRRLAVWVAARAALRRRNRAAGGEDVSSRAERQTHPPRSEVAGGDCASSTVDNQSLRPHNPMASSEDHSSTTNYSASRPRNQMLSDREPQPRRLWRVTRLMGVGILGAGAAQLNLLINLFIASFLAAGSISWLYYADRLMELPVGLLGAAMATVALPALARRAADAAGFARVLDWAMRVMAVLAAPAAVGLVVLAMPLVAVLFLGGAFSRADAEMTAAAVRAYGFGVIGLAAVRPLAAAFFARQDFRAPLAAAVVALAVTQGLNAVLVWWFGWGHIGLALSVGLAACANSAVLFAVLWRRGWYRGGGGGFGLVFLGRLAAGLAAMGVVLWLMERPDSFWLAAGWGARAAHLAATIGASAVVYFGVLRLVGVRPADFKLSD